MTVFAVFVGRMGVTWTFIDADSRENSAADFRGSRYSSIAQTSSDLKYGASNRDTHERDHHALPSLDPPA